MPPKRKALRKVLVVVNPVSGIGDPDQLQEFCRQEFSQAGWQIDFHVTSSDNDDLDVAVQQALNDSCSLVVVSGGDGTVAAVSAAMAHSDVPLGIIPSGTWNAIARHLEIPLNLSRAVALILGEHSIANLDLMAVGDTIHAMNLSIGFSASMIQNTGRAEKQKYGIFAYFSNALSQVFGLKLKRYHLVIDGQHFKTNASEILVLNYGIVGLRALENFLEIHPDDGKMDLVILRARTLLDAPALFWRVYIKRDKITPIYRIFSACSEVSISAKHPVVVQADGEIIGTTPVRVKAIPHAVQVIIPSPRRPVLADLEFLNPLVHPPER